MDDMPFGMKKLFNFMGSHILIVDLSLCAIDVMFRKPFSVPMSSRFSPFPPLSDLGYLVLF